MAGSKATKIPNVWDRLRQQNNMISRDAARSRLVFNPQTTQIQPHSEIPPAGESSSVSGDALLTSGGTMTGSIAFDPKTLNITDVALGKPADATSRTLDISVNAGNNSSRIIISLGAPTSDLEFIAGAANAGQLLNIQGSIGETITIKNDASGDGSAGFNIRTQTGGDLTLVGNANIILFFDAQANQFVVVSDVSGAGTVLSFGQLTDVAITPDPPTSNDIIQFNTTSGLWENVPASATGALQPDLANLQAGAVPVVDMSLNNQDLENVTEIRMNAAGNGLIDNLQTLDFFQFNHFIQSFGDRMEIVVDAPDSIILRTGTTEAAEIRSHGIDALDIRFPTPQSITQNTFQIVQANNAMSFNVPDTRTFSWLVNASAQMTLNATGTLNVTQLTAAQSVFLAENPGFSAVNGRLGTLNGDVIIGSGGNSVNITDLFDNTNSGQFADDTFTIFNAGDPSKVATFNASSIIGTRIYTFQNANGRLALLDGVQQDFTVNVGFTNKNLVDVGGIFTTAFPADIGQASNFFSDMYINQLFFFFDASKQFKIGGNTQNGFDFVVSDTNKEFDFFFDGSGEGGNPSWIIRSSAIDAQGGRIEDLEEIQFDGNSVINPPSSVRRIGYDGGSFQANMQTGGFFSLLFNGTIEWFFSATALTGDNLILNNTLNFNDAGGTPFTGQMLRSGNDIFVSTTNGVKNMKDIGGAAGPSDRIESPNSTTTVQARDVNVITKVGGVNKLVVQTTTALFLQAIDMSGNEIDMGTGSVRAVQNITMQGSTSILNMNFGDISNVDDLSMRSDGSGVIFMNGGTLVMGGGDIVDINDINIDGDLNHDGSRVGFFGEPPNIRRVVLNPQNTTNNELFTRLNDLINALGTINGFGLGLIDTQN